METEISCGIIVFDGEKVLLVKHKGGHTSFPKGHVEEGETEEQTAKREVKEELGIDISNDNIVDLGYPVVDFPVRFVFYLKKDINLKDVILQKDEVESVSYMSEDKLREVISNGLMHAGHTKVLERVLEYRNRGN